MEEFVKLSLKEMASIISTLGVGHDVPRIDNTNLLINGKIYTYEKDGDKATITCEDGKKVEVSVKATTEERQAYGNVVMTVAQHETNIDYFLEDGGKLRLTNHIPLEAGYEAFENVRRHDLMRGLGLKYIDKQGNPQVSSEIEVNKVCLEGSPTTYEFTEQGIKVGNKLVTLDGNKLISISGEPTPSVEEVYSFDKEVEKRKLEGIIEDNPDLHKFTKERIEEAIRKLDITERSCKRVEDFYTEDIKGVRGAIAFRNYLLYVIQNNLMQADDLSVLAADFYKKVKEALDKQKGRGMVKAKTFEPGKKESE